MASRERMASSRMGRVRRCALLTLVGLGLGWTLAGAHLHAADWPTYQHDIARSGVTSEHLAPPLVEHWRSAPRGRPIESWSPPLPVPVGGILEQHRVRFDDAYHVAVVDGTAYFGSSADHKVYALDAATGQVRWSFITGGPVRLAPTVTRGRVFVGSDDGHMYCLDATNGRAIWTFSAAPRDDRVLGRGKMISLWPIRAGALVDGGIVYFGAGIFPSERVFLYAVRADDGTLVWKNDQSTDGGYNYPAVNFSPQGYMLATATTVYVPGGRAMPAHVDRKTGQYKGQWAGAGRCTAGGTYALLAGERLFSGPGPMVEHAKGGFAWFPGRRLVVTRDVSYMATDKAISSLDRKRYVEASRRLTQMENKKNQLKGRWYGVRRELEKLKKQIGTLQADVGALDKQLAALKKADKARAAIQSQRDGLGRRVAKLTRTQDALSKQFAVLTKQRTDAKREYVQAKQARDSCMTWQTPCPCADSMILAGRTLFAGGKGQVVAIDVATGKVVWTAKLDGTASGLAVSDGRLIVSSNTGTITCFGKPGTGTGKPAVLSDKVAPLPKDKWTPVFTGAAEGIVNSSGVRRGYCLVLGGGTGRLAYELAKRTELVIYCVEADAAKVAEARRTLDAAGVYGTRVCVDQGDLTRLPYSDYFANLIVSETVLVSGRPSGSVREMYRVLKPVGGVVCIGQPATATGVATPLDLAALRTWLDGARAPGVGNVQVTRTSGRWAKVVRGVLPGAADWTHQYANPGGTACSGDRLVRCPLGVLWFGDPGPNKVVNRHLGNAAPLCVNGRTFLQGRHLMSAFDAYNGLPYWERKIPGAYRVRMIRDCSNLAASQDSLFVAAEDVCHRLDAVTGQTQATYRLPPAPGERKTPDQAKGKKKQGTPAWGYVATVGDLLLGSTSAAALTSDRLFAIDLKTGQRRWVHQGKSIQHITICIGGGRIYFADQRATRPQRETVLADKVARLEQLTGIEARTLQREIAEADVRVAVALDLATGKVCWQRPVDLTECGAQVLTAMCHKDTLVFCGAHGNGHYWPQFFGGLFSKRRAVVLSATDGRILWHKAIGYRHRPLIIGDTLYAEPWAFELRTGKPVTRVHPLTGERVPWEFIRPGHHCGAVSACPGALFFRSGFIGYYDLVKDHGVSHFTGQRPGCWINVLPTQGLAVIPEASSGCVCMFAVQCTVVLHPRQRNNAWPIYVSPGKRLPVKHLAVNLCALGDRRDRQGTLWLAYPRPSGRKVMKVDLRLRKLAGGGSVRHNPEAVDITGTDKPWLFNSGYVGMKQCVVPLVGEGDSPATYTVRLHFAERVGAGPADGKPTQRVFDIKLQGKLAEKGVDLAKEAGGRSRAIVKEFRGVAVTDNLTIEFVPKAARPTRQQMPNLAALEIVRRRVHHVVLRTPSVVLNDSRAERALHIGVVNRQDRPFVGTLVATPPDGFAVKPKQCDVRVAPDSETTVTLTVAVMRKGAPGTHAMPVRLMRDGSDLEWQQQARIEYLGPLERAVVKVAEDAYASQRYPGVNYGRGLTLRMDGGHRKVGDQRHEAVYLKFKLDVPGRPVSASRLRVFNADRGCHDSGRVRVATDPWDERKITYANRPKPGPEVGRLGCVEANEVAERTLSLPLKGRREITLVLDPTSCASARYYARESGKPAELVVEYEPHP